MKSFLQTHKQNLAILGALILTFQGATLHFESFGKPENHLDKYPLFFGSILLIAIYAIPLITLINYFTNRFKINLQIVNLSWLSGIFIATSLSTNFHMLIGYFIRNIFHPSEAFIAFWGAAISAPLAEEFGKGLAVLLVLFICRKIDIRSALVSGMIVGLGFQIIEDCVYTFQDIFVANKSPFPMLLERIIWAGCTHWLFTSLFIVGFVIIIQTEKDSPSQTGFIWMLLAMIIHFLFNIPMNSEVYDIATATLSVGTYLIMLKSVFFRKELDGVYK